MSSDDRSAARDRDDRQTPEDAPTGHVDSDDTTQADAGMAGGTGSDQGQGTVAPVGTRPHSDDDELNERI